MHLAERSVLVKKEALSLAADPLAPRRRLGAQLRRLREAAGFYLDEAADHLECSPTKLSRLEIGFGVPKVRDVRDLLDFYRVTDRELRDKLLQWAKDGQGNEWWLRLGRTYAHAGNLEKLISLEAQAAVIKTNQPRVCPGLFQTPRYARSIIEVYYPDCTPEELTDFVNVRIQRQEFWLERDNPAQVIAIVDESAFYRSIGSVDILREQIEHLIYLSTKPFCSIRMHPFSSGIHTGAETEFIIFEETTGERAVIIELFPEGVKILRSKSYIEKYTNSFDQIFSRCLSEDDSRDFLSHLAAKLDS